jgi:hypothetical protein
VQSAKDAPDYHSFQGAVTAIRRADFLDRRFLVFRIAVFDLKNDDLAVDLYMDRARFGSCVIPTAGEMVSGTLASRRSQTPPYPALARF